MDSVLLGLLSLCINCYVTDQMNIYRTKGTIVNIEETKRILKKKCKSEYHSYIETKLAGDFSVELIRVLNDHAQIVSENMKRRGD